MLTLEKPVEERKQDWLVQKSRLQRVDTIQAEPPLLLLSKEKDKRSFCSQGRLWGLTESGSCEGLNIFRDSSHITYISFVCHITSHESSFSKIITIRLEPDPNLFLCWGERECILRTTKGRLNCSGRIIRLPWWWTWKESDNINISTNGDTVQGVLSGHWSWNYM